MKKPGQRQRTLNDDQQLSGTQLVGPDLYPLCPPAPD